MLWIEAVTSASVGSATATPKAAVEMSTIQTKKFFMAMLLMCSPLNSGMESSYLARVSPDEPLEIYFLVFLRVKCGLNPDIFIPEFGLGGDKALHHGDAGGVLYHFDGDATGSQEFFFTHEGAVLTDDHFGDAVEQDGPGTHSARR